MIPSARNTRFRTVLRVLTAAALGLLAATLLLGTSGTEAAPRWQSASQLIDAVNQFRAASGMGPLTVDPILMQLAQEQSDYNASTGELSHYGPSGRLTRDDAIAAGYGGGSTVFVSENIAVGSDLTEAEAVQMWTGDEPHLNTMLGQYYRDVGAGAEERNGEVYYTLVTGYVAGGFSANSTVPAAVEPLPVRQPLITVTPLPDGSIIHVVAEGQTLWTIAAIYGLDLSQLLSLNGMTEDSFVVPGQEIVVRASPTATAPTPPSATPSASPGPPTVNSPTPTPAPMGASLLARAAEVNPREILGGGCIAAWIILVIAGLVVAARRL